MSASLLNRSIVNRAFVQGQENAWGTRFLDAVALRTSSMAASERYAWLSNPPRSKKREGALDFTASSAKSIDVVNYPWQNAVTINRDDMRRDQTGQAARMGATLADAMIVDQTIEIWTMLQNGDTTTNGLAYDGLDFWSASHSEDNSGTQKNLVTATEIPDLNITTATAPTAEEAAVFILGMIGYMMGFVDSGGRPMNSGARNFMVVYPLLTTFHGAISAAVSSNNLAGGATNPLAGAGYTITPVGVPSTLLDWTTEIAVLRTDGVGSKPFIHQVEEDIFLQYFDENSDMYKKDDLYAVKSQWTGNFAYGQWQHAIKGTLS